MRARSRTARLFGGLRLTPRNRRKAAIATVLAVLGVTMFIVSIDGWLFRAHLPGSYVDLYTSPLVPRMFIICGMALVEEVKFRLLLMTGLVALASVLRIRPTAPLFWAVIVIAQFANVWPWVLNDPLYASLRFWAVGCVWGWLYWKHGWLSAAAGHGVNHLLIDPLLLLALK